MTDSKEKTNRLLSLILKNSFFKKIHGDIKSIPRRGIKNVSYLAMGNFVSQFINIVGFIYVARMLGPKNYGIYVTVSVFVEWFELLLLDGLNTTVLREGSKDLVRMHIQLEKSIGLRNALILAAITMCITASFFTPYQLQTKLYILLFSFQIIYNGIKEFFGAIYQATEKMKYISILQITNRLLFVGLSIFFLSLGFGLTTVFLISLFSNFFTLFLNFRFSRKLIRFNLFAKIHVDKNLLKPAVIFSLMSFLGYFSTRVDLLMISLLGTPSDVGIYGVAFRIAQQGMVLRSMTEAAFFPIFIKRFHRGKMEGRRLIRVSLLFLVGIFAAAFLASLFVEDLVPMVFGAEYQASAHILSVLIFYVAFGWVGIPFSMAAKATHNEKYLLIIVSITAVLNVVLNYVFFLKFGLMGIAYSTLVVFFVAALLVYLIIYRVLKLQGHLV
jgi:O-antigen/teichoic acid export membrane protein